MAVANLVALDDFGGLQTLYLSLAAFMAGEGRPLLTVNRAARSPLPVFSEQLSLAGIHPYSPMLHPATCIFRAVRRWDKAQRVVQRGIMHFGMRRIFRQEAVRRLVSWNALPLSAYLPPNGDCFVYDHGMSSIQNPTALNRDRLKMAREVVAISMANARLLQEIWGWERNVQTIANPLRLEIAGSPLKPRASKVNDDELVVGAAARLVSFKGVASLVHAASIARARGHSIKLRIAGDGPEANNLKRMVRDLNADAYVKFDGLVLDMANFFSEIDIFVAPSLREPFGLSPLEALATGVPTILSNVDGHAELVPFPGAAVLITPDFPLDEYQKLGSSLKRMPRFVYSPTQDCLVGPRALDPEVLAEAIIAIAGDYEAHAAQAGLAALQIRQRHSMREYTENFTRIFECN